MIVSFEHPARGLITATIALRCHVCGLENFEPIAEEQQQAPGEPVVVHCTRCHNLAYSWAPPPVLPPSAPPLTALVQRIERNGEVSVTTGQTDPNGGWVVILSAQSPKLAASEYELTVGFELSLAAAATWGTAGPNRTAQARLLYNGVEIGTWVNPFDAYDRKGITIGAKIEAGATPIFSLELRRFGAAGTARIRRTRMQLSPIVTADVDEKT